ncbi:E3 ubiquitin-protein ligase MARCH3 isoform X4 [Mycetomoellerius zeteki]|uniref:E3 ubiquitin-protein ligase MARCH3 isoform X4 n=1 Tax=Mycetomoellerius zeteki TaxID=64791 RepID=UPI00084E467B|nr:PREDICTED: E3 ubiquitin-protein ligase MARCH3-like isoform X4 [Trachymyrmex zeteki]
MSHVEDAEPKNGSGRTNEIVANERDKFVAQASPESSVNVEIRISASKTNQILDNIKSDLETEENDEKCVDIKSQDKDSDICRICHMGGYASITDNHPSYDTENLIDQTSILSNFVYLGPLISACKCRGTVALVHAECLERWLTESGRARCELCGYKYAIRRVRRYSFFQSVVIWFRTIIATRQEMLLDIGYLVMTTPVAVFSCYLCALALKMLMRNGFYEIPWMIVAMLPTCLLTLIAYWRWIITLGRLHGHRWRRYWRNNFVVRLIPDNDIENSLDPRSSNDLFNVRDDFEQWRLEENDEFV